MSSKLIMTSLPSDIDNQKKCQESFNSSRVNKGFVFKGRGVKSIHIHYSSRSIDTSV